MAQRSLESLDFDSLLDQLRETYRRDIARLEAKLASAAIDDTSAGLRAASIASTFQHIEQPLHADPDDEQVVWDCNPLQKRQISGSSQDGTSAKIAVQSQSPKPYTPEPADTQSKQPSSVSLGALARLVRSSMASGEVVSANNMGPVQDEKEYASSTSVRSGFINASHRSVHTNSVSRGSIRWYIQNIANSALFETGFASMIMLNALVMSAEVQYNGVQIGHDLGYDRYNTPAADHWPSAVSFFWVCEWFFGIIFSVEVVIKILALRKKYFKDPWNLFDLSVVVITGIVSFADDLLPVNVQFIRLMRLARLGRLLRLVRTLEGFDALFLISRSLRGSFGILGWALMVLFVMELAVGLFVSQLLHATYFDDATANVENQKKVYKYFGTLTRSLVSMLEITLANWSPICRLLSDEVSEWFFLFSVSHKVTIGFAVVGVLNGVFMQETFKVAATDDNIMVRNKRRTNKTHASKIKRLFEKLDASGDGKVSFEEFKYIAVNPEIRTWLASMDLRVTDADLKNIFTLCDSNNDGCICAEELIQGLAGLRGTARSLDLLTLMDHLNIRPRVTEFEQPQPLPKQSTKSLGADNWGESPEALPKQSARNLGASKWSQLPEDTNTNGTRPEACDKL